MMDYHDIYLKTDVLLLADVFEAFRTICHTHYKLDPAHIVSAPHLSWDAMLKMTGCKLELISDPAMFRMLDNGIRGGVSMISKRKARANNPTLGAQLYKPDQPTSWIVYLDANNLYGWAMSQPLPTGDFRWVGEDESSIIDWKNQRGDQQTGYIVECDLDYPETLQQIHNDYPLAPERLTITHAQLSETQMEIRLHYNMALSAESTKLVPSLLNRRKYWIHYAVLQFYL
jgi:hypothetical protein